MASIIPKMKSGKIVSYKFKTCVGKNEQGKQGKPISGQYLRHQYTILNLIFKFAERQEIIAKNPMNRVDAPKNAKKPVDALSTEQADHFFQALKSCPLELHCILQLLITTGIRRGECTGLQWQDIDEQASVVRIERNVTYTSQDVIIVSPVVAEGWLPVLEEARDVGIPVLLVDRMVAEEEDMYTSFIGADFEEEGRRCARWLNDETEGQSEVRVLELRGTDGSSPAQNQKTGFESALAGAEQCKIVYSVCGDFTREGGRMAIREYLEKQDWNIDAIYAHNDEMALGAAEVLAERGIQPGIDVKIMSIDGTSNALDALLAGKVNCVVECNPLLGPQLMKAITDLMQGKELPLRIITDESVFTKETPKTMFQNRKY